MFGDISALKFVPSKIITAIEDHIRQMDTVQRETFATVQKKRDGSMEIKGIFSADWSLDQHYLWVHSPRRNPKYQVLLISPISQQEDEVQLSLPIQYLVEEEVMVVGCWHRPRCWALDFAERWDGTDSVLGNWVLLFLFPLISFSCRGNKGSVYRMMIKWA